MFEKPSYRKRALIAIDLCSFIQSSGDLVINVRLSCSRLSTHSSLLTQVPELRTHPLQRSRLRRNQTTPLPLRPSRSIRILPRHAGLACQPLTRVSFSSPIIDSSVASVPIIPVLTTFCPTHPMLSYLTRGALTRSACPSSQCRSSTVSRAMSSPPSASGAVLCCLIVEAALVADFVPSTNCPRPTAARCRPPTPCFSCSRFSILRC